MADTPYLSSDLQTGLSGTDLLDLKLETQTNFNDVFNKGPFEPLRLQLNPQTSEGYSADENSKVIAEIQANRSNIGDYLSHPNSNIRNLANSIIENKMMNDKFYTSGAGGIKLYEYDKSMDKFLEGQFGYRPDINNEDFYYRNEYMADGWGLRNLKNLGRLTSRVVVGGITKFASGLGTAGSLITGLFSEEPYMEYIADNAMSRFFDQADETFKEKWMPVYRQAGYDDKGFFSKIGDWTFWNESVADGLGFVLSAAIPAWGLGALGKAGKLGRFGSAFSQESALGRVASKLGVSSPMELATLAYNTSVEAAIEARETFNYTKESLQIQRARGLDITDEAINERAAKSAADVFKGNMGILLASNLYENALFFKPFKKTGSHSGLELDNNLKPSALSNLDSKSTFTSLKSTLARPYFYGSKIMKGLAAEGLWEENAQLAISRINSINDPYNEEVDGRTYKTNYNGLVGFLDQSINQIIDGFSGNDQEAAESIGLGGIIGGIMGVSSSKMAKERKNIISNTRKNLSIAENAYNKLFSYNDIYKRDTNNNVIYNSTTNLPEVDPLKLEAKQKAIKDTFDKLEFTNLDEYMSNEFVQFEAKQAFADYIRSMSQVGITDVGSRLRGLNPNGASIFGLDPTNIKDSSREFIDLADKFSTLSSQIDRLVPMTVDSSLSLEESEVYQNNRKQRIYKAFTGNEILNDLLNTSEAEVLTGLNARASLSNNSLNQFPFDYVNKISFQIQLADESSKAKETNALLKDFYSKRVEELKTAKAEFIKNYGTTFEGKSPNEKGFYIVSSESGDDQNIQELWRLQRKSANYENLIAGNNFIITSLLDSNIAYESLQQLNSTDTVIKAENFIKKENAKATPKSVIEEGKYGVEDPSHFATLVEHARKVLFSDTYIPSEDVKAIAAKYPDLLTEILNSYQDIVENQRVNYFNRQLQNLQSTQESLAKIIKENESELDEKSTVLEILLEELELVENKKPIHQNRILKSIEVLKKEISSLEDSIQKDQLKISELDDEISLLDQEIEGGSLEGLRGYIDAKKQERDWLSSKIAEKTTLIDKLKKILNDIRRIAYKLFGSKAEFIRNLEKGRWEAIEYRDEIQKNSTAIEDAKQSVIELNEELVEVNNIYDKIKDELNTIVALTDAELFDKYVKIIQKDPIQETRIDKNIANAMNASFEKEVIDSQAEENIEENNFDGDTYQRPLATKFSTTTFNNYSKENLAENVAKNFELLDLLTNPEKSSEVKSKLGNNSIVSLIVTRNNIDKLGLVENFKNRLQFFNEPKLESTNIEIIPVLKEGDSFYYINEKLEKLGKVGEPAKDILASNGVLPSTPLRSVRFTEQEREQYLIKYKKEEALNKALDSGRSLRTKLLDSTKNNIIFTSPFTITRGIPNKQLEGNLKVKNPIPGTLLPTNQINPDSVRVFATPNQILNKENIEISIGKPYIYTNNNDYEQLHFSDVALLSEEQIDTILKVLNNLLTEHNEEVKKRSSSLPNLNLNIKNRIKLVGISGLNNYEKKELFGTITSKESNTNQSGALFNNNLLNFLSSIVYFSPIREGKEAHSNQIHIKGFNLNFGSNGPSIDITDPDALNNSEIRDFLQKQYHNIRYFTNPERAASVFIEYYLEKGELKTRVWPNYATYLLSPSYPNKSSRNNIPLTTSIKNKSQLDLSTDPNIPKYQYISRAMSINTGSIPVIEKEKVKQTSRVNTELRDSMFPTITNPVIEQTSSSPTKSRTNKALREAFLKSLGSSETVPKEEVFEAPPKIVEPIIPQPKSTDFFEQFSQVEEGDEFEGGYDTDEDGPGLSIPESSNSNPIIDNNENIKERLQSPDIESSGDIISNPSAGNFRINNGGYLSIEDINSITKEISNILPQFPVQRLSNVLKTLDGREAMGQFLDNTIYLYEGAEKGTGYHEAFEAVVNRLLSDAEWRSIYKEFLNRKGSFLDRGSNIRIPFKNATEYQAKEQLAEEFMDFKLNGALPSFKQTKSFLKIIWDFIKSLFTNQATVNKVFQDITEGKLSNRAPRISDRFIGNYRLTELSKLTPMELNDLHDGATAFMFVNLYNTPDSLSKLDQINLTGEQIYEPIRQQFIGTVKYLNSLPKNETRTSAITRIQFALNNWVEFIKSHKEIIRQLNLKFIEENTTEEEVDSQNQRDYITDVFKIDNLKAASTPVKLLFRSLLKFNWNPNSTIDLEGKTGIGISPIENSVFMSSLVQYDSIMVKALDEFSGLHDFSRFKEKLAEISGLNLMDQYSTEQGREELSQKLSPEQATYYSLYRRLFAKNPVISDQANWKLQVQLNSYFGKHSPTSFTSYIMGGEMTVVNTSIKEAFLNTISNINSALSRKDNIYFEKLSYQGKTIFKPLKAFGEIIPPTERGLMPGFKQKPTSIKDFSDEKAIELAQFLGLEEYISKKTLDTFENKAIIKNILYNIKREMTKRVVEKINVGTLEISGYVNDLVSEIDRKFNISNPTTQIFNIQNQAQSRHIIPSFTSRIISEINNVKNKKELFVKYPFLEKPFSSNSILLNKLFDIDGNRTKFSISLGYMDGITSLEESEGTKTAKLSEHDRYLQQFNASLQGLYYTLPADATTEFVFNFGEFESYSENMIDSRGDDIIDRIFIPYLMDELATIKTSSNRKVNLLSILPSTGKSRGESLRFFKNILSPKVVNKLYKLKNTTSLISNSSLLEEVREEIKSFLRTEVEKTKNELSSKRLLSKLGDSYYLPLLSGNFVGKYNNYFRKGESLNETQLNSLLEYQKINSIIGGIETFKIVFGDPAQFKAFEKRAKSFLGPYEDTFYENTGEFNNFLNHNFNQAKLGNESVDIINGWFQTNFSDSFRSRTIEDLEVVDVSLVNTLKDLKSEFADRYLSEYESNTETDGQSMSTIGFTRQLFIKSGWRWTDEMENFYQYDTALMRKELSELSPSNKNYYEYTSDFLRNLDKKIIENYTGSIPDALITPYKTLMPYVDQDGYHNLLKHSVFPISYSLSKGRELLNVYTTLLKSNSQLLNFKSAHKEGLTYDNENRITSYYENPFKTNNLDEKGNPIHEIQFRNIGIQVETQGNKAQTVGTQLTKLANLNVYRNGIPVDFMEGGSDQERLDVWRQLTPEEKKSQSNLYKLVHGDNGTITTLEDLKLKNTLDTLIKLGIPFSYEEGEIKTTPDDLRKVKEYIDNEFLRLGTDANTLDSIRLTEDYKEFINSAEALPSHRTISNVLWSIADKAISSFKVNGKSLVQVSSAFFNKKGRGAAYLDPTTDRWINIESEEEYKAILEKNKSLQKPIKVMMTSSELKMYGKDPETGITTPMEILAPYTLIDKVNKSRILRNLPPLSDEEMLKHLNKNPKLLQGIGFRIPTQATSSVDFFVIKDFLPRIMGNAVVVPSALTKKTGSDFDIDKLNTYFNNWKLDGKGLPYYEEFQDNSNSRVEDRYSSLHRKSRNLLDRLDKLLQDKYGKEIFNESLPNIENLWSNLFPSTDNISFWSETEIDEILGEEGFTFTYEEIIKKAAEEEQNSITLEQFKLLPISAQNTKGALENRYFQSIRTVLQQPMMFEQLLSPNSTKHLEDVVKVLDNVLDRTAQSKEEINYLNFISTEFISAKRHQFVENKDNVAIAASAMTNFANSQVAGISVSVANKVQAGLASYIIDTLNNGYIQLPFEDSKTLTIDNTDILLLSNTEDSKGDLIMDKLSSYVNAFVDVATNDIILRIGMSRELAGTALIGERLTNGEDLALFFNLPPIQSFLKDLTYLNRNSYSGVLPTTEKGLIVNMIEDLRPEGFIFNPNHRLSTERLKELIKKSSKPSAVLNSQDKYDLYFAFINFLKMRVISQDMLTTNQTSNHDTAKVRSHWAIDLKDIKLEILKQGNLISFVDNNGIGLGAEGMRNNTFLRTDIKLLKTFDNVYSQINLFALRKTNPKKALRSIAEKRYRQNPYISADKFIAMMKDFENGTINYLAGEQPIKIEGLDQSHKLRELTNMFFSLNSKSSIYNLWNKLRSKPNYQGIFRTNEFLKNLEISIDPTNKIYQISSKITPSSNQIVLQDTLMRGFQELASYDPAKYADIHQFYKALVYAMFIQFGVRYTKKSLLKYVPFVVESDSLVTLSKIINPAMVNIDNVDLTTLEENLTRALWYRNDIIPKKLMKAVTLVNSFPTGDLVVNKFPQVNSNGWEKLPTATTQRFFSQVNPATGAVETNIRPIFVWGGYLDTDKGFEYQPDYFKLPIIRNEFLSSYQDLNDWGQVETTIITSKTVQDMIKRGDWNFITYITFKKVGLENPSLGRSFVTTNKEGKESVNYLYKPIHTQGNVNFAETTSVKITDTGTTLGKPSIIPSIPFIEYEDLDLISKIKDPEGRLITVSFEGMDLIESKINLPSNYDERRDKTSLTSIDMKPSSIIKVATGAKTTILANVAQAKKLGIKKNKPETRLIGGDPYLISPRGLLTIQQAGGLKSILKSEGVSTLEELEYNHIIDWIKGKDSLFVYDITPIQEEENIEENSIERARVLIQEMESDIYTMMFNDNPQEFLQFIAQQYYDTATANNMEGSGIRKFPQEAVDIATKMYPKSFFLGPEDKPKITC